MTSPRGLSREVTTQHPETGYILTLCCQAHVRVGVRTSRLVLWCSCDWCVSVWLVESHLVVMKIKQLIKTAVLCSRCPLKMCACTSQEAGSSRWRSSTTSRIFRSSTECCRTTASIKITSKPSSPAVDSFLVRRRFPVNTQNCCCFCLTDQI